MTNALYLRYKLIPQLTVISGENIPAVTSGKGVFFGNKIFQQEKFTRGLL